MCCTSLLVWSCRALQVSRISFWQLPSVQPSLLVLQAGDAKISDVGLSRMMHAGVNDHRTMDNDSGMFGTFAWAAPEVRLAASGNGCRSRWCNVAERAVT